MRIFTLVAALTLCAPLVVADDQGGQAKPPIDARMAEAFGPLPKRGNISDILSCAGANELFWVRAMKSNPRDPEAHEAKRKAGWYTAVALWVYEVESSAVIDAINVASTRNSNEVTALARQCREAPHKLARVICELFV